MLYPSFSVGLHKYLTFNQMVVYIVCYDLQAPPEEQEKQLKFWLAFLNSSMLPCTNKQNPKWKIILVGLRKDACKSMYYTPKVGEVLEKQWSTLPIHTHHAISSKNSEGVRELFRDVESICNEIFKEYSVRIPSSYIKIKRYLEVIPINESIVSQVCVLLWTQ